MSRPVGDVVDLHLQHSIKRVAVTALALSIPVVRRPVLKGVARSFRPLSWTPGHDRGHPCEELTAAIFTKLIDKNPVQVAEPYARAHFVGVVQDDIALFL